MLLCFFSTQSWHRTPLWPGMGGAFPLQASLWHQLGVLQLDSILTLSGWVASDSTGEGLSRIKPPPAHRVASRIQCLGGCWAEGLGSQLAAERGLPSALLSAAWISPGSLLHQGASQAGNRGPANRAGVLVLWNYRRDDSSLSLCSVVKSHSEIPPVLRGRKSHKGTNHRRQGSLRPSGSLERWGHLPKATQ